jgi:hypothetical protein
MSETESDSYPIFFDHVRTIKQGKDKRKRYSEYYSLNNIRLEHFYKAIVKI